jgi:hypothetical protein
MAETDLAQKMFERRIEREQSFNNMIERLEYLAYLEQGLFNEMRAQGKDPDDNIIVLDGYDDGEFADDPDYTGIAGMINDEDEEDLYEPMDAAVEYEEAECSDEGEPMSEED